MASTHFKGNPLELEGNFPAVGTKAPDFKVLLQDLSEVGLAHFAGKIKVLLAAPSLDTATCAKETREFNVKLSDFKEVIGIVVSSDLPFAQKRFCAAEGIDNVITGSQFRDFNFSKTYGTHIPTGPLTGLSARAVFVVDKNDMITYTELVPEVGSEPDYDKALEAIKKLV
jgi:thiol peroxidase